LGKVIKSDIVLKVVVPLEAASSWCWSVELNRSFSLQLVVEGEVRSEVDEGEVGEREVFHGICIITRYLPCSLSLHRIHTELFQSE
jgi:hypothetical protein